MKLIDRSVLNGTPDGLSSIIKNGLVKSLAIAVLLLCVASCKKDFTNTNTDHGLEPDITIAQLLTTAEYRITQSQYTEWFYDNYAYIMPWSQQIVRMNGNGGDMNQIGALGNRYSRFYSQVWPYLYQIQRNIDALPEQQKLQSQKMRAVTYVLQVYEALRVTDVFGSIPYTEALRGRYDEVFSSKYDNQQELFNLWLSQLDSSVNILSNPVKDSQGNSITQTTFGNGDYIYASDWVKWARLANAIKLRIAVRLENIDLTKAKSIFEEVKTSIAGVFADERDQCENSPATDFRGEAYDFNGSPSASKNFIAFLKVNNDPRLRIFFEKNAFNDDAIAAFNTAEMPLPACINPADSLYRYVGAPGSPDSNIAANKYYFSAVKIGDKTYPPLSYVNRRLFNPGYNNGTGTWTEVMVSYAEVCFYIAEFVEKGYVSWGAAKDWYEKGVKASINTYNKVAVKADLRLEYVGNEAYNAVTEAQIAMYMSGPNVAYGISNLEKIYLQQYVNFFMEPNETFALIRRTGYPKKNSSILPWQPLTTGGVEMPFPRRFVLSDPGAMNRDNWTSANHEQGFTPSVTDPQILNTQRIWWDKNSPAYGSGK